MISIHGDVTNCTGNNIIIPHVCNDLKIWGSGVVVAINNKWKQPKYKYMNSEPILGTTQFVTVDEDRNIHVANMIAQTGLISASNPHPLIYEHLEKCMTDVRDYSIKNNLSIHAPRFGSLRAGGDWDRIEKMIEQIWIDIDTYIYIYP